MRLVSNEDVKQVKVTDKDLKDFLGAPRYYPERQVLEERVGVVNGLAWTSVGGELLEVEVNVVPGSGKVELTGNLGDVMKESAHAALSFIRSQADRLGIPADFYKEKDIHVHFPEGAVPKEAGRRHDRRGDPAGPGAAHRRAAGEDHGRPAQRHPDGHYPGGQRQGPG